MTINQDPPETVENASTKALPTSWINDLKGVMFCNRDGETEHGKTLWEERFWYTYPNRVFINMK